MVIKMRFIKLIDELSIKKMDIENEKDRWLAQELDQDPMIVGEYGYLYPIERLFYDKRFIDREYLINDSIYGAPYTIYYKDNPIGYIELSKIEEKLRFVDIAFALLESKRGKGYATKIIKEISKLILTDSKEQIEKVLAMIDIENKQSQAVVLRSGFISDGLSEKDHQLQGYILYEKTKTMLKREECEWKKKHTP